MKMNTRFLAATLFLGLGLTVGDAREFSSADGTKTMSGTVTAVSATSQKATIRRSDGSSVTFPISALAAEDREYLIEWYKATEIGRKLDIRVNAAEEKGQETKTATARRFSIASQFGLSLRNNAAFKFEDLEVRYRMFHTKDIEGGKTEDHTTEGVMKIDELFARAEKSIATETVSLDVQRPLPASQCPGGT